MENSNKIVQCLNCACADCIDHCPMYAPGYSCLAGIEKEKTGINMLAENVLCGMFVQKKKKEEKK